MTLSPPQGVNIFPVGQRPEAVVISPDGHWLAVGVMHGSNKRLDSTFRHEYSKVLLSAMQGTTATKVGEARGGKTSRGSSLRQMGSISLGRIMRRANSPRTRSPRPGSRTRAGACRSRAPSRRRSRRRRHRSTQRGTASPERSSRWLVGCVSDARSTREGWWTAHRPAVPPAFLGVPGVTFDALHTWSRPLQRLSRGAWRHDDALGNSGPPTAFPCPRLCLVFWRGQHA